jgi:spore coat protein U-like protein
VIGNAPGCTLNRDVDVTGQLALTNGDITTGANPLTLAPLATTTGAGDVWGSTRRAGTLTAGKVYTFGNPNISLNFASATTMPTDVTINLVAGPPVGFAGAVNRSYTITPNGGSNYSATVRLRYLAGELGANIESRLHLWRYDGTAWQNQDQSASTRPTSGSKRQA